jgi:hypothetical protein
MSNPLRIKAVSTEAVGDGLSVFDHEQKQSFVLNATSARVCLSPGKMLLEGPQRSLLTFNFRPPAIPSQPPKAGQVTVCDWGPRNSRRRTPL